jgi:aryl-alcohol dehydrogenase-like predicted oxidoreductase
VIDIVHLHSCGLDRLEAGEVARALADCAAAGRVRVAAYSGDGEALRHAMTSGRFGGVQASVNLCDQESLPLLAEARAQGIGTIAKRPFAGQPWRATSPPEDAVHAEYWRRFASLRPLLGFDTSDWEALALRFAAYAPGVDCVIVGGTDPRHLDRNVAALAAGPLEAAQSGAIRQAFGRAGARWQGLV